MSGKGEKFEPWRYRLSEIIESRSEIKITELSEKLGRNRDYLARLVKTGTAQPTVNQFLEICFELDVDPAAILTGSSAASAKIRVLRRILDCDESALKKIEGILDILD